MNEHRTSTRGGRTVAITFLSVLAHALLALGSAQAQAQCVPPPAGLVGWWTGDGTAEDSAGSSHGTLVGARFSRGFVTDSCGQAFAFDGNDYVSLDNPPALRITGDLTIEAWIYVDADAPSNASVLTKWGVTVPTDSYGLTTIQEAGVRRLQGAVGDGITADQGVPGGGVVAPRTWTHVAWAYDAQAGDELLYTNGSLVATRHRPGGLHDADRRVLIGAQDYVGGVIRFFKGLIDEASIYDRVLTQTELQAIHDAGPAGKCKPTPPCDCLTPPLGIVAWYPGNGTPENLAGTPDGTLEGDASFAVGTVGDAFSFDGSGDFVDAGSDSALMFGPGAFTIEAWIRPASIGSSTSARWLVSRNTPDDDAGFRWGVQRQLIFRDRNTGEVVTGDTVLPTHRWTHVAVVRRSTAPDGVELYVDGVLDGMGTSSGTFTDTSRLLIGKPEGFSVDFFDGLVDELTVYSRALLGGEIAEIYRRDGKCALPTADAGEDLSVDEGALVALDGSASSDPLGLVPTYDWTQVAGTPVTLDLSNPAMPSFTAPTVPSGGETLTFQLVVSSSGGTSVPDTVNVVVKNVNHLPDADAGDDQTVQEGSPVVLDASHSFDQDGETLTYSWVQTGGTTATLTGDDTATPTFTAPEVGAGGDTLTFEVTVFDGIDSTTDTVVVNVSNVNQLPIADAGSDQTADELTLVTLDGTGSGDPDGDGLTYSWTQVSGPVVMLSDPTSATPSFTAPPVGPGGAEIVFELVVHDGEKSSAPVQVRVHVQDTNDPPDCTLATDDVGGSLWPPNHALVPVGVVGVSDPDGNPVDITILSITQDEPVNGLGDGDTSPDAVIQDGTVLLRAERQGGGNGRVYQVSFLADDGLGGTCMGSFALETPHDRRSPAIDDGQLYDSTGGQ